MSLSLLYEQAVSIPYLIQIYIVGAVFLGFSGGLVGALSFQKRESLIGDTLGHAVFPGIMLAYIMFQKKESEILFIGAIFAGLIAYFVLKIIKTYTKLHIETIMAIVLSTFFGLGLVLYKYIFNNHDKFKKNKQGLDTYIFGQIAYISETEGYFLIGLSAFAVLTIALLYKEIKLHIFDPEYAQISNISNKLISSVIVVLVLVYISFGIKLVGTILISAVIVSPAAAASQWTKNFSWFLFLSSLMGAIGSCLAMLITIYVPKGTNLSSSGMIILVLAILAIISVLVGPKGFVLRIIKRAKKRKNLKNMQGEIK